MHDDDDADRRATSGDGAEEVRSVDLPHGRRLVVRHAGPDDLAAVEALYERLPVEDLRRRFFVGHRPPSRTTARWLEAGQRGGVILVAEVVEGDGSRTVAAEAGYELLDDGDGELAIAVDRRWRGWLGAWLLDVLATQAAERGVANLQADVLVDNSTMLALLRHRGYAAVAHPGWDTIRLVIGTTGPIPGWPPDSDRKRVLATSPGARWRGEAAAKDAGFEVRTCPGPVGQDRGCPVLSGRSCPLLEGADAVVFDLVPGTEENAALLEALEDREDDGRPGDRPVVVVTRVADDGDAGLCQPVSAIIDQIIEQLGETTDTDR